MLFARVRFKAELDGFDPKRNGRGSSLVIVCKGDFAIRLGVKDRFDLRSKLFVFAGKEIWEHDLEGGAAAG